MSERSTATSLPSALYVWLVPSEHVQEQPGSWRIRKWDTEPFPEANFTVSAVRCSTEDMVNARLQWVRDLSKANMPFPGNAGLDGFAAGWTEGFAAGAAVSTPTSSTRAINVNWEKLSDEIEREGIERVIYGKGLKEMAALNRTLVDALRSPHSAIQETKK